MAEIVEHPEIVSGLWKFSSKVSRDEVVKLAAGWMNLDSRQFVDLHVRAYRNGHYAIVFQCRLMNETQEKFVYRLSDQLRRAFGNDLVGWDISSPIWKISPES